MGIKERVHFTGFINPSNLPEIYQMSNIFITASEIETQGIVLLEAAASGLPIVAIDATCISEIVHDQFNGFLIKQGDIQAFSTALLNLINDPNRSYAMGLNGRMLANEHDIEIAWTMHDRLYGEMARHTIRQPAAKKRGLFPQWKFIKELIGLK